MAEFPSSLLHRTRNRKVKKLNSAKARGFYMRNHTYCGGKIHSVNASVPELLRKLRTGDRSAVDELTPTLYRELHRIAARHLAGERPNHTLQATALVHEAYLKLFAGAERKFEDKVHFLAVGSRVMRQVLVDYARARASQKRSGGADKNALWKASLEIDGDRGVELLELIELDSALQALAAEDESLAQLIEMRYFGGMTAEETAEALGLSVHTVRHDLRFAQAWLRRKLTE
jgi:RNA polymerase sigma factor (TIGR02999 family)